MTTEALPPIQSDYALSDDQKRAYAENGHLLLRGVASPEEIAAYRPLLLEAVEKFNTEKRALAERDTYGKAFLQIMNLWARDENVRRFTLAKRFAKIAADLMGVEGVRIYHDQALFKEAGGGGTPWHQDGYYWPLDTDRTITMWMPLVDANSGMGTMRFASRSGENGYLGDLPISDDSERLLGDMLRDRGYPVVEAGEMHAGDATFHSGWNLHGANGNGSDTTREVMTIIYFADGARVTDPQNDGQRNDLNTWLPGLNPGDLAASELNPLVYP